MPIYRALAKNMAASYFGKKAPYGFVMDVTLLYVSILCYGTPMKKKGQNPPPFNGCHRNTLSMMLR
jgi:hypothetical protein